MSYDYSENKLVQDSAGNLLRDELGWEVHFAYDKETLGENGTFGRKSYQEIILEKSLSPALRRLNPWINETQIFQVLQTLKTKLATETPIQTNERNHKLIRDGIDVDNKKPNGEIEKRRVQLIDFKNPQNNHFLAIKELKIHSDIYRRRADIVGFVNGIPLLFIELKGIDVDIENAYTDNYTDYQATIPHLFYHNAFSILSNGRHAKVGTLGSPYQYFHEWKRLTELDAGNVELQTMLRGICKKENFLDLFENFILFDHSGGQTVKILARNHQYLGVNEAAKAYQERKLREGKLGVFWHTQGSGKSYSMVFLSQKIRRKYAGSPTIIILTDREELNSQISDTFENCGLLGESKSDQHIATSGNDLIHKLQSNPSFIFTLIQKFNKPDHPPIIPNHDILIMSDEAHRSQYGIFAENMDSLLPTASKIGFTGTPLLANDNITERTFGSYISIYDFKRAVEDGATVPLYYENRGEKIKNIENPEITDQILQAIENADLDPTQQEKLEREFSKQIHILTAEPRLDAIAKDFVHHYTDLWTSGKAMFVCLNKVTCVRMYNLVQKYWQEQIDYLQDKLTTATQQEAQELKRKLSWMKETEIAVVISQEQNEIQTFQKWGLDILPHREKMEKRKLDKDFKDSKHPFRVAIVCAMWLTGFDVKSLSCLYLDKPIVAHNLMQTIARANRVDEGKSNGLIIDYIGIVKALREALANYTANPGDITTDPTIDKDKLIQHVEETISQTKQFLETHNISLQALSDAKDFDKLSLLLYAADAMCESLQTKKTFQTYAHELEKLFKYLDRNDVSKELRAEKNAIIAIYSELQKKRKHTDNTDLMVEINAIVNEHIRLEEPTDEDIKQFDISKINFKLLEKEFRKTKTKHLAILDLNTVILERIQKMLEINPNLARINFYELYQEIISDYNKEQDRATIEKTFHDLMELANSMTQEEKRYVSEGLENDEQLAIYDMLFNENLSKKDIEEIKTVAAELLQKVKTLIAELDHWADKQETKAKVDNMIRDTLWDGLPQCYDELSISQHRQRIYEYVYTHYSN